MKYRIETFGCKSNQYESQAIREVLRAAGHEEAGADEAEVYIVNTCAVTGRAGASCRNALRRAVRGRPDLKVVITGCGVDLGEKWPELPAPPVLVPNAQKHAVAEALKRFETPAGATPADEPPEPAPDRFALSISRFEGHTRAFLKIQDGCDNFCSYCAVPRARGVPESRAPEAVLAEAERLAAAGHAEIVLTGINIGAYAHSGLALADLVAKLARTKGLERLRLGSVEPPQLTEPLVHAMAENAERVCPHIHLPLQSGDDAVLAAMRRRYTAEEFLEKIALLRKYLDRPAVSTDVIVGFPGETDASAAATEAVCRAAGFSRLHVFLFSPRPGTPAAEMRRTAADADTERRKSSLIRLGQELAEDYARSCVGLAERVIAERSGTGLSDRYVRTALPRPARAGEILHVKITAATGAELSAEVLKDSAKKPISNNERV